MLASSDVDGLAALIDRLRRDSATDPAQIERATERWLDTKIRTAELKEEIERMDRRDSV